MQERGDYPIVFVAPLFGVSVIGGVLGGCA